MKNVVYIGIGVLIGKALFGAPKRQSTVEVVDAATRDDGDQEVTVALMRYDGECYLFIGDEEPEDLQIAYAENPGRFRDVFLGLEGEAVFRVPCGLHTVSQALSTLDRAT